MRQANLPFGHSLRRLGYQGIVLFAAIYFIRRAVPGDGERTRRSALKSKRSTNGSPAPVQTTKVDADYPENKLSMHCSGFTLMLTTIRFSTKALTHLWIICRRSSLVCIGWTGCGITGISCLNPKLAEGFLKDDRYFYFQISADGETVMVENEKGVGFVNEPVPHTPDNPSPPDRRPFISCFGSCCFRLALSIIILCCKQKET